MNKKGKITLLSACGAGIISLIAGLAFILGSKTMKGFDGKTYLIQPGGLGSPKLDDVIGLIVAIAFAIIALILAMVGLFMVKNKRTKKEMRGTPESKAIDTILGGIMVSIAVLGCFGFLIGRPILWSYLAMILLVVGFGIIVWAIVQIVKMKEALIKTQQIDAEIANEVVEEKEVKKDEEK